jgi:hypothetical protein
METVLLALLPNCSQVGGAAYDEIRVCKLFRIHLKSPHFQF